MLDNRAVVFLGRPPSPPPLEVHDRIRPVGHRLIRPEAHDSGPLQGIMCLPVLLRRSLLHQQEGLAFFQAAHQGMLERHIRHRRVFDWVGVPGDDIQLCRPLVIIQSLKCTHQVGGNWNIWSDLTQNGGFGFETAQEAVRLEAIVIDPKCLETALTVVGRRLDLRPLRKCVPPERGVPAAIDFFQAAIAGLKPVPEGGPALIAIAGAAIFIADVPNLQGWMLPVPLGQASCELSRKAAEVRRIRAE